MNEQTHGQFSQKPLPDVRNVSDVMSRAESLRLELPYRVLKFKEDWDIVILADEIKRLNKEIERLTIMIDIP